MRLTFDPIGLVGWAGGRVSRVSCVPSVRAVSDDGRLASQTNQSIRPPFGPGIGRHAALHLADKGGFLVLAGVRRPQDGEALKAKAAHPERIVPVILDVTKPVRPDRPSILGWHRLVTMISIE